MPSIHCILKGLRLKSEQPEREILETCGAFSKLFRSTAPNRVNSLETAAAGRMRQNSHQKVRTLSAASVHCASSTSVPISTPSISGSPVTPRPSVQVLHSFTGTFWAVRISSIC